MRTVGVFLIFGAVVLRAIVVLSSRPQFFEVIAWLAIYGVLLFAETVLIGRSRRADWFHSRTAQLAYLLLQSTLVISLLITSSYEDFFTELFIPLSLDAVSFFGKRLGFTSIAVFSLAMIGTFLFSDNGPLFGLAMGIMYCGINFLFGGYAYQVRQAEAAHGHNQRMFSELQAAHGQLQGYANQLESLSVEHERNRLARDLHDSVTQTVFSMNLAAQSARLLFDKEPPRAAGQLIRIEELAANALLEIQTIVSQLRPRSIVEEGLPVALRRLADEQKALNGLQVHLEIHGEAALSEKVAASLFSIVHEALFNVSKHSGTGEAIVRLALEKNNSVLEIQDHGLGFDPQAVLNQRGHLGLAGMAEQAHDIGWHLSVESACGEGTRIRISENPARGAK